MPLNPLGRVQAEEVGRRLKTLLPDPASLDYVASPLDRTRRTMEILRGELGLPPDGYRLDDRLKEITFGDWEGLTWREVRARDARQAAARERDKWRFVPPGGESYAVLSGRIGPFLAGLTVPTVVVSHGGVARAILEAVAGMPRERAVVDDIWQGRVLAIRDGRHDWI